MLILPLAISLLGTLIILMEFQLVTRILWEWPFMRLAIVWVLLVVLI